MEAYSKGLNRIWELDFLRGIALIMMIYFHVVFDMENIFNFHVHTENGINYIIGKISAILFILLSGVSSVLSQNNAKRAFKLLTLAMTITLVTWYYSPSLSIKFGILHFLGICILISSVFQKLNRYFIITLGTFLILSGSLTAGFYAPNDYFLVFGITSRTFSSLDYYPLIPWLGIYLYGLALGKILYSSKQSIMNFNLRDNPINSAGRHTLLLYMLHQPVILAVFFLINLTKR